MDQYAIHHDLFIKAPLGKVYDCLVQPTHLINWWPLKCSGQPNVGEIYNFNFTDAYDWYGKVIKAEENKSFHIQMTKSDDNWNSTSFGFDLEIFADKVRLKFSHQGWPACNDEYRQSSYCWAILLLGLKNYAENGIVIPFNERE